MPAFETNHYIVPSINFAVVSVIAFTILLLSELSPYLDSTDRILPLAFRGRTLMEKEAIELPRRFQRRRAVALALSCYQDIGAQLFPASRDEGLERFVSVHREVAPSVSDRSPRLRYAQSVLRTR